MTYSYLTRPTYTLNTSVDHKMADPNDELTDQFSKTTEPSESHSQPKTESHRRASTDTTQTTLPPYDSLSTGTPPTYTLHPTKQQKSQEPTAGASAATIRAIMGDPIPEEPRRSLRDRLLCRHPTYNRHPSSFERERGSSERWNVWGLPSSERERGSSARWNVWGSPVSDVHK
jgi:hypothetical protein